MKKKNELSVKVEKKETNKTSDKTSFAKILQGWGRQVKRINPIKSVGMKLFLIFLCAIVMVVMSLGLISYFSAKKTIKNNVAEAYRQTIIQTSEKLDITLKQYENLVYQIYFDEQLQTDLVSMSTAKSDFEYFEATSSVATRLTSQITTDSNILSYTLIPESPELDIVSSGTSSIKMDGVREQEWYKQIVANAKSYSTYYTDDNETAFGSYWFSTSIEGDGDKNIAMLRSLKTLSSGEVYNVLLVLQNTILEKAFASVELGDGSRIQLVTPEGIVVASTDVKEDGLQSSLAFVKESKSNNASLDIKDEKGEEILAVFNPMVTADWKLAGIVPTEELVKDARPILLNTFITAAGAALLAMVLGLWMVRMIAHPLARLKDLMVQGAKGDLSVRTGYVSRDEIGQLSESFNLMMERITELVSQTSETAGDVLDTAGELGEASRKTAISAKEIAAATEEIAGGAGSLALEAERGNELTELISTQMQNVISANSEMDLAARGVGEASGLGAKQLEELLNQTGRTGEMTSALVNRVNNLKETVFSVIKVLDVMQSITQQTNILSLNATIEAARAGEAGRGFMVVAGEVRQLADQSKQSIALVAGITDKIITEMNETVAVLSEVAPLFKQQMSSVKSTSDIFISVQGQMNDFIMSLESVTTAITSLSHSQGVLSESMGNVSAVAEQSSATSQEVASLSNEQQNVSDHLVSLSVKLESASTRLKDKLSLFTIK